MRWKCNIEGHEDVVVNNPREARDWQNSQDPPITGVWRRNFDPDRSTDRSTVSDPPAEGDD